MPTIQEELLKAVQKIIEKQRDQKADREWNKFYDERADRYRKSEDERANAEYYARWPGKGENC